MSAEVAVETSLKRELALQAALDASQLGVWEWEAATGRVLWTEKLEQLHGLEPGEFPGTFEAFQADIHPDDRERVLGLIQAALDGGEEYEVEYRILPPDGRVRWLGSRGRVLRGEDDVRMVGVCMDITPRRRAEEERDRLHALVAQERELLRTVLDQMPAGVVIVEAGSWAVLFANEQCGELLGSRVEEGRRMSSTSPVFDGRGRALEPERWPILRALVEGEVVLGEHLGLNVSGARRELAVSAAPVRTATGEIVAAVSTFFDVSERERRLRRNHVLGEAGTLLAASLDPLVTLGRIAELAASELCDWCSIHLLEPDGSIANVAVAHADPSATARVVDLVRRYPADPRDPHGAGRVIRTGRTERLTAVTDELLVATARDDAHLQAIRELGLRSAVVAPLVARGRPLGAIGLAWSESGLTMEDSDVELAEELGRRAGLAVENARLNREQRVARADAEQLADRLQRLQTILDATLAPASLEALLPELLPRLKQALSCDSVAFLLLDEERGELVPEAVLGLPADIRAARFPVGRGFAGRIAATGHPHAIEDISGFDTITSHLSDAGITSVAGVPLALDGKTIGVLHVGKRARHVFTEEEVLLLRLLASRLAAAIDRAQVHGRDRSIAEHLQRSLLPTITSGGARLDVAARYLAGGAGLEVGGDWYDVFETSDGCLAIAIGDVVGRGITAAATMGRIRSAFRAYALEDASPAAVAARLNRLALRGGEEAFSTAVFARYEREARMLTWTTAGHLPPILVHPGEPPSVLEDARCLPIGAFDDAEFVERTAAVPAGAILWLYTDGLVELRGDSIEARMALLHELLAQGPAAPQQLIEHVVARMHGGGGNDDVAVLAARL